MWLWNLIQTGGPIMPLIVLAALVGYVLAVERLLVWGWWTLRDRPLYRALSPHELRELLMAPRVRDRATPLSWLLLCAVGYRDFPSAERDQAMQIEILAHIPHVEARITTIGWLGNILPMLGLLGTVSGMIVTFQDLAVTTSRQVLSEGLSQALWTTEVGLIGAVPLLAANHLLTRLKAQWLTHLERCLALMFQREEGTGAAEPSRNEEAEATTEPPRAAGGGHEA